MVCQNDYDTTKILLYNLFWQSIFYEWSFKHFGLMLPRPIHTKLQRIYVQKTLFDYYYKWCVIFQTSLASNLVPYLLMLK